MTLQAIHSVLHDDLQVCGKVSLTEMSECSNVQELQANLYYTLQYLVGFLTNLHVDCSFYNSGAVQEFSGIILSVLIAFLGSSQASIQSLVVQINDFCLLHNIDCHTL